MVAESGIIFQNSPGNKTQAGKNCPSVYVHTQSFSLSWWYVSRVAEVGGLRMRPYLKKQLFYLGGGRSGNMFSAQ